MIAILTDVRWYLIVVLICVSMATSCWASFHVPVGHLFSLGECLFSSSAHFKSWIFFFFFFFLLLSCMSSLCFLESKPLSDIWFANIFSHFIGCAFTLMIMSLDVQKHFSLSVSLFAFVVISKKGLPRPMSRSFSPMFFPNSFFFSGFVPKSLICFELIFMTSVRYGSDFVLLHVFIQFSQH